MSFTELVPVVQALPRADKLRLMQLLVLDLASEEGVSLIEGNTLHPIWAPHEAYDAAAALLKALEEEEATP